MANETYLYRRSLEYARQTRQITLWRASHQANIACKEAIETSIRQGFDGMHLKAGCVQDILEEYGFKRVGQYRSGEAVGWPVQSDQQGVGERPESSARSRS